MAQYNDKELCLTPKVANYMSVSSNTDNKDHNKVNINSKNL